MIGLGWGRTVIAWALMGWAFWLLNSVADDRDGWIGG
jgi:hypothetical protein